MDGEKGSEKGTDARKERDGWDKADVIFKIASSVITALAALVIAYYGSLISNALEERKLQATYTDLLSRREEADGTLRKDMFKSIIDSFLDPKSKEAPLGRKILNLELLTHNFHDSLNLKPLFTNLRDEIDQSKDRKTKENYLARINEVAMDISRKQMLILEQHGKKHTETIDLKKLVDEPQVIEWSETLNQTQRKFSVVVLEADPIRKKLKVSLRVADLNKDSPRFGQTTHQDFRVGFFDFPMIDNTRLSDNERCAVVLNQFDGPVAEIEVVYFSGDYASLKDKAYFPEVLGKLFPGDKRQQ
jgi:hypothetical protein